MDKFNLKEYLKNNPLLKENISMEDGEDKITYYAKELIKMHTPGDEDGVEGLLTYLADNPEEMPEDWDVDFIQDPNNYNDIMDKIFALTPMQEEEERPYGYKVELLVPTVYYDVANGELYADKNTYYTDAELEGGADQTSYTDGDRLDLMVFDGDYDTAKEFEEDYPGLFKVV